jgi:hypothetical protein
VPVAEPADRSPHDMPRNFYFPACLLMCKRHRQLWAQVSAKPQADTVSDLIIFNAYWFASLYVVVEGWRGLNLSGAEIDKIIDEHLDSLRLFRNAVFHFQPKNVKHKQWADHEKWNWAERLTLAFERYFDSRP